MAISITWGTKVINVPKADMSLIQADPEIRELDLDAFRLSLKDLEDDPEGMPFPDTHRHNTEVTLAGLTYARIIEIINGYTVQFEDGQYTVNCVGANHNLSDVKVANQVSLIVNNAAGLITNPAIEYSSFNGGVTIDETSSYDGTLFPVGTLQRPVNNLSDALLIASYRGFSTYYILGDISIDDSADYSGSIFIGESITKSEITVGTNANVLGSEFYDCTLLGVLDGESHLKNSRVGTLQYINGVVEQCILSGGTITLGGSEEAIFLDCWAGSPTSIPIINMGGSGQDLSMRNYSGTVKITNLTGSQDVSITLLAGEVIIDSTVTAGSIYIAGNGIVTDNSGGSANVDIGDLMNPDVVTQKVWDEDAAGHDLEGSFGWYYALVLAKLTELWQLQGLDISNPMTVTPTSRQSGSIDQTISGDGETTTTVTRN